IGRSERLGAPISPDVSILTISASDRNFCWVGSDVLGGLGATGPGAEGEASARRRGSGEKATNGHPVPPRQSPQRHTSGYDPVSPPSRAPAAAAAPAPPEASAPPVGIPISRKPHTQVT